MKYILLSVFLFIGCGLTLGQGIPVSSNKYFQKIDVPNIATKPNQVKVSVNSENKNQVYWSPQPNAAIVSYKIYKKSDDDRFNWICIGSVKYGKDTTFVDSSSLPSKDSPNYMVSLIDICGNELLCDSISKPIRLSIDKTIDKHVKLNWNQYRGMKVLRYYILRGYSMSNLTVIDSVSSSESSYFDQSLIDEYPCFQVAAIVESTKRKNGHIQIEESFSNRVTAVSTLLDSMNSDNLFVYNDDNLQRLYIIFPEYDANEYSAILFDLSGKIVYQCPIISEISEIEYSQLQPGLLILSISGNNRRFNVKIKIGVL